MKLTISKEKQRRQVKYLELARQRLGLTGVNFEQGQIGIAKPVRGEQLFPGTATGAALAGKDDECRPGRGCQSMMKIKLIERDEDVFVVRCQKNGLSLAFW